MTSPFDELKDIFSTPPTEARYSWVIHGRHESIEGSVLHHPNPPIPVSNGTNPFCKPNREMEPIKTSSQCTSPEITTKKPNITPDSKSDQILDNSVEQEENHQPLSSPINANVERISSDRTRTSTKTQRREKNLPCATKGNGQEGDKENNTEINSLQMETTEESVSTVGEFGARVFGSSYDRTKHHFKSRSLKIDIHGERNKDGSQDVTEYHYKNLRLHEEINSATKKLNKLNQVNQNALKRKGELQKEILDAYKKISELEVARHATNEKQREMMMELKTAKQRIGEAEREAAHAIGCSSKLQRELIVAENKSKKYLNDLNLAERRISKLEKLIKDLELEHKHETEMKNDLEKQLCESEATRKIADKDQKNLEKKLRIKEKEMSILENKFEREKMEKQQLETKSVELDEANRKLRDDLKQYSTKYDIGQRTLQQYTIKLVAEREKFQLVTMLKSNAERELRDMKQQVTKEQAEKELIKSEHRVIEEKYKELKRIHDKTGKQNEHLRKDNRDLKDRVLYLKLYQKISETKMRPDSDIKRKKKICFLDTLEQIKIRHSEQKSRDQNDWQDSWNQDTFNIQHGGDSCDELDRLSEMSAKIEQLQKEQKVLNHVSAENCSKSPRQKDMSRESNSSDKNATLSEENKNILNESMPNIYTEGDLDVDEKEDEEVPAGNLATFSDLLHDTNNRDIANALL